MNAAANTLSELRSRRGRAAAFWSSLGARLSKFLVPVDVLPRSLACDALRDRAGTADVGVDTVVNTLLTYTAVAMRSCHARRVSVGVR
jgi:hypothetical protein